MRYRDRVRLRCFRCRYAYDYELLRWFLDDGQPWVQQVLKQRVSTGEVEHTGGDPVAVFLLESFEELVEAGKAEEM